MVRDISGTTLKVLSLLGYRIYFRLLTVMLEKGAKGVTEKDI